MNTEDQQLIRDCLAGQTEAFGRLVLRYQDRLFNSLVHITGSHHEAHDVAQDAFVAAFQKLNTFRGQSAFYSWLFRIARNAAINRSRKRRLPSTSIEANREKTGMEPVDPRKDGDPSHSMELSERQIQVRTALAELAEEYRTVLVLKEMDNLKYEEIAEILDCPIGTVRSRLHRARIEMREKLELLLKTEQ